MSSLNEKLLLDMAALNQNFHVSKSKLSGDFDTKTGILLHVDTSYEPETWKAMDEVSGNQISVTDITGTAKSVIGAFILQYKEERAYLENEAKKKEEENKEPPKSNPLDNLAGFEGLPGPEENPIIDSMPEEKPATNDEKAREYIEQKRKHEVSQPKKEQWSKPAPKKQPEQIPYDEGLENTMLPAITGIDIVRPVVNAVQALAIWNEFQDLKQKIILDSDKQIIEVYDKRTNSKKKSAFIKKSGWRKLATCFNLTDRIVEEIKENDGANGFLWKIKVVCRAPNGRESEGVGMCASSEKTGPRILHDVYSTAHTRAKNRAISDMIAAGEVSAEEMEGGVA